MSLFSQLMNWEKYVQNMCAFALEMEKVKAGRLHCGIYIGITLLCSTCFLQKTFRYSMHTAHSIHTLLICYSKHMGSSLASLPYRPQVIYHLLKIHIHINLNSSTVHSYFELVCPFRDLGKTTGPIFQTQSQERSVFMMSVDALLPSALLWKLCETSHGFLSHT